MFFIYAVVGSPEHMVLLGMLDVCQPSSGDSMITHTRTSICISAEAAFLFPPSFVVLDLSSIFYNQYFFPYVARICLEYVLQQIQSNL